MKGTLIVAAGVLLVLAAIHLVQAQNPGIQGDAVHNQILQLRAVTPSDTATIQTTRALFNGNATACNIAVVAAGDQAGQQQTFQNVQAGSTIPVSVWRVMNTNTTCSNILAGY